MSAQGQIKISVFSFSKDLAIPAIIANGLLLICLSSLISFAFAKQEYDSVMRIESITLYYKDAFRFSTETSRDSNNNRLWMLIENVDYSQ